MSFNTPITDWSLCTRFSVEQYHLENFLPKELAEKYRTARGMAYFQAYGKFGMIDRYGYEVTAGLAFMAVVFEIAGEIHTPSSNNTSPYFTMCMEIAKKLSADILQKMDEDSSQSTSLIMLFISLAYQNKPSLH